MGISRKRIAYISFLLVLMGTAAIGPWQLFICIGTIGAFVFASHTPFVFIAIILDVFFAGDASQILPFSWGLSVAASVIVVVSIIIRSYTRIESYAPRFSRY